MGSLVGFFLFSFVADNYGRKIGLGSAWVMATIGSLMLGV
jgi:OCT family organic cation transporter-like MFS transporter 4/5